jgi:glycerol-3-phosphate dehydrogenase
MIPLSEFSPHTRTRNLQVLERERFDLLVIGGGITGAGIARDATMRGLRVALVERRDFASGTSSRSSKLIHGGIRYLAQGDVGLVREAANERRAVRRLAPHLATPLQVLIPVYGRAAYATIATGLWTYDRMARVLRDERNRMLSCAETLALEPGLRGDRLYGAGLYYEYLTDDARLVIATMQTAAALGAVVANYAEVVGLLIEGGRATGAFIRDAESGAELKVEAKVIVNAAGPWVDEVRLLQGVNEKRRLRLAQGIHVIVPRARLPISRMVSIQAADKRGLFAIPRVVLVYLGTTDTEYEGRYDDPPIQQRDVDYLLAATNRAFTVDQLGANDIVGAWSGLRPLVQQEGKKTTEISRRDEILVGPTGLVTIAGGKLTTFRKMAARVVDTVLAQIKTSGEALPASTPDSETTVLVGGDTGLDIEAYARGLKHDWPQRPADIVDHLVTVYGSTAGRILETMREEGAHAARCAPDSVVTDAEVAHAVRFEMALTVEDFLERRSRRFLWAMDNGLNIAPRVARQMGSLLGWDERRIQREVAAYEDHVRDVHTFQSMIPTQTT